MTACFQKVASVFAAGTLLAGVALAASGDAGVTAVTGVTVIPMDAERTLLNQTVVIADGRIVAMGETGTVQVPTGVSRINGTGRYLIPGLADMHAHVYGYDLAEQETQDLSEVQAQLLVYAATGVTLLRDAAGTPGHLLYRERVAAGDWIGPDLFVASPIFEGERNVWDFTVKVTDPAAVEPLIADYAKSGYWGLKIYHTISPGVFDAIMVSAQTHELPVMGHVPFDMGIDATLESGITSIEHLRGYDFDGVPIASLWADGGRSRERFSSWNRMTPERRDELVAKTVAAGVWNVPTLAVNRMLFDPAARAAVIKHPRFARLLPAMQEGMKSMEGLDAIFSLDSREALREAYPVMLEFIKALSDVGAGLMTGTDSGVPGYVPGFTVIDEIQSFGEAGLTPFQALQASTIAPARYLGIADDRGTVAVGKRADLVLLDNNPLEDLSALWEISGVFLTGRWHSLADLEAALDEQSAIAEE
ncbi:MAG: amidohydrolase family protein [Haliea sp.]|uniref:amidohydrolase family protein n=1 Tax=Marinobacter salarius TaxID=1420917 RepID=UPI0032EE89D6